MKQSTNQWKYNCKQPKINTNSFQSQFQNYISLATILYKVLGQKILHIKSTVLNTLKQKLVPKKSTKQKYLQDFMNHCSVLIQSNYRGFIQRKRYKSFLPIYRRFKEILIASIKGWKTRKILKLSIIRKQKQSIGQNQKLKRQKQVRIGKRQFVDDFNRLFKNGKWIQFLRKQPRYQSNKALQINRQQPQTIMRKLPLYENIKAVKNLKDIFTTYSTQKRKIIQMPIDNSLKQKPQMYQNCKIKKTKCSKTKQSQEQVSRQKYNTEKRGDNSEIFDKSMLNKTKKNPLGKKTKKSQLQIKLQPQVESKLDSFSTPKYNEGLLKQKRTLNLANSLKSKNQQLTLKKSEKENENNLNSQIDNQQKDNQNYKINGHNPNEQDCFSVNASQKRKQKKGLAMTLSKNFQFQVWQNNSLNFMKKNNFVKLEQAKEISQFKQLPIYQIQIQKNNHTKQNSKNDKMKNIEISKSNFQKRKFQQDERHRQIECKIQILKKANNLKTKNN